MKQDAKRFSSILVAGFLLAASLIVYFEFIIPAYGNLETLKGQEQSELALYNNEKQISDKVNTLLSSVGGNSSTSQLVAMALPVGQDLSGALAQIYGLATSAGVTTQNTGIAVQAVQASPQQNPSGGSGLTAAATTGSVIKPTGSISLQITGTGSYENIKTFLQGLETNIRIFDVTAMSLQPAGGASNTGTETTGGKKTASVSASSQDIYTYNITATTYYQAP